MWEKIKQGAGTFFIILGFILFACVVIIPYIFFYQKLKKEGSQLTLFPTIGVKKVTSENDIDKDVLTDAVRLGKEAVEKIKNMQKTKK